MAFDPRLILIGLLVAWFMVWAWWRLVRHPQYGDQPAWARWAYLAVVVAMVLGFAVAWTMIPP